MVLNVITQTLSSNKRNADSKVALLVSFGILYDCFYYLLFNKKMKKNVILIL